MGLSIHYSGGIFDKKLIKPLIEEVRDICEILKWATHIFDNNEIKGICFAPAGSEPICLTFNRNGHLLSPTNIPAKEVYDGVHVRKDLIYTASTKTQYAGPDAHIAVIKLLKHISAKYLAGFTLSDEGYYWETGDEKILLNQFKKFDTAIDSFRKALENLPYVPGELPESIADKLEKILKEKFEQGGEDNSII